MSEDQRTAAAIHDFYVVYRELQKYDSLRMRSREAIGEDTLIEVDRYHGERKGERVLKVEQEHTADAYKQAAEQLKEMLEKIKTDRKAG